MKIPAVVTRGVQSRDCESFMVRPEGVEPPTYWFVASCSIQLSYGRTLQNCNSLRISHLQGESNCPFPHQRRACCANVLSTEATDSFLVRRAVERPLHCAFGCPCLSGCHPRRGSASVVVVRGNKPGPGTRQKASVVSLKLIT